MELADLTVTELSARLVECNHAIATATHERLLIIAALDTKLTSPDTPSGCVKAVSTAIAAASKCLPKHAAADVRLARDYVTQPDVQAAFVAGDVTVGQLGYVTTVAADGNSVAGIDLAKNGTMHALKQLADSTRRSAALRAERDRAARTNRRVRFTENDDQTEMSMITTGPWIEINGVRQKLEQAAQRMRKGFEQGEREWFDAAMYDALLANLNGNIIVAKPRKQLVDNGVNTNAADNPNSADEQASNPSDEVVEAYGPNESANHATTYGSGVLETGSNTHVNSRGNDIDANDRASDATRLTHGNFSNMSPAVSVMQDANNGPRIDLEELKQLVRFDHDDDDDDDDDDEPFPEEPDDETDREALLASLLQQHVPKPPGPISPLGPPDKPVQPIIVKTDAKVIVTVNITNGTATYLNGPAISHPRLDALLCFANIDVIAMIDGQPVALATNQRTATPAQGRYMIHRDGPCRTPGCPGRGPTQFHHVPHYALEPDNGTSTAICIALCMGCHHDHHDGKLTITGNPEGTIIFTYADGRTIESTIKHNQPPLTAA